MHEFSILACRMPTCLSNTWNLRTSKYVNYLSVCLWYRYCSCFLLYVVYGNKIAPHSWLVLHVEFWRSASLVCISIIEFVEAKKYFYCNIIQSKVICVLLDCAYTYMYKIQMWRRRKLRFQVEGRKLIKDAQ